MELKQAIQERRSVRRYQPKEVPSEVLDQILDLALYAPTASNMQAWNFVAINDPATVTKVRKFSPGMVFDPAALIVIGLDTVRAEQKGGPIALRELMYFDAGIAAYNISLTALEMGLGTCIVASFNKAAISALLEFPETVKPLIMVALGYPEKIPNQPKQRTREEVIFHGKYGK